GGDGLQIPIRYPGRFPRAQLQHVSTRARLSRSRNGGLCGTARGGVRGRKAWIQRDQASARSGHRLLRRCRSGYRRWPILHHGVARFNRTRTVSLNRAETASSAAAALTDSRLAALCAEAAQHAFGNYQGRFDEITRRARARFLAHDLKGSYADATERLHLYGHVLADLTTQITDLMGPRLRERNVWTAIKAVYSSFVAQSPAWEIGESFFNSLTRRVFATEGVDQAIEFVDSYFDVPPPRSPLDVREIYSGADIAELISAALTDSEAGGFAAEYWNQLDVSVRLAAERVEAKFFGVR